MQDQFPSSYLLNINSSIRHLYFNPPESIGKNINLTPNYPKNIKIGVVIGTYGSVPYVDLNLHYLKNVNNIENILVHDDHSDKMNELSNLCKNYNVDFYSTEQSLPNYPCVGSIGDESCFYEGLKWAKAKKLDILVKVSRRMIPCFNWKDNLINLIEESDGITFSSYCEKDKFPIRTEMIAMNVNAWTCDYAMKTMDFYLKNKLYVFAEYWYSELAKELDFQNISEKYLKYKKNHFTGYRHSGYVHWYDTLGTNRYDKSNRNENVLWHQYSKDEEYLSKMNKAFGDKYKLEDLK